MHELGIMESTLALVQRHAAEQHARRVTRIVLRIGAISGVETEALRFAFEAVSPGTPAEGAEFAIESVPVTVHCPTCDRDFAGDDQGYIYTCPHCGDLCGDIRTGRELELSRIEFT